MDGPVDSVGPVDRAFPWASVTKPATALAVLVAVEEGSSALDDPAGPPGSTVRHLLAHASGLGPDAGPAAGPTRDDAGSTRTPATWCWAELVAERPGMPFADYLQRRGARPAGHDRHRPRRRTGPRAERRPGLSGPLADLLSLGRELAVPTLISAETHRRDGLRAVRRPRRRAPRLPAVRSLRLGPRCGDPRRQAAALDRGPPTRRPRSGTSAGPARSSGSIPVAGVICAGLSDRPFGPWAVRSWPALADAVLAEHRSGPS